MLVLGGFFLSSRTLVQIADAYGSDDQTANFQVWLKQNSTFGIFCCFQIVTMFSTAWLAIYLTAIGIYAV